MANINNFNAVIDNFVERAKDEMLSITKNAIQDTIKDATTPISKGGRMPVDTGFLRQSGVASLNVIGSGLTEGRKRKAGEIGTLPEYAQDTVAEDVTSVLGKMKLGDTFYYGWTAVYANKEEMYKGFLTGAVLNWGFNVKKHAKRADARKVFK